MSDASVPPERGRPAPAGRVRGARAAAVRVAKDVLGGSKDVLGGLREIVALWPELDVDDDDEDFAALLDVAAEVDELPIGPERAAWPRKLLAEADRELADARKRFRKDLLAGYRRLLQRFAEERRAGD